MDVVSWFLGVLQQLSVDARMQNVTTKVCRNQEWLQLLEKRGENEAIWHGRETVGLWDLRKIWRRRNQVAARFGDNGGGGWAV